MDLPKIGNGPKERGAGPRQKRKAGLAALGLLDQSSKLSASGLKVKGVAEIDDTV